MGNFARVRAPGAWTDLSELEAFECEAFDAAHVKTINASDGSAHAPSSEIVIGGSGIKVTGPSVHWDLLIPTAKTASIAGGGFLDIHGTATIKSGGKLVVEALGQIEVSSDDAVVIVKDLGSVAFQAGGICGFADDSTLTLLAATVTDGATWTRTGTYTDTGATKTRDAATTIADASATTRTGPTTMSGDDAAIGWRFHQMDDEDTTIVPSQFDVLKIAPQTTNHTLTLDDPADDIPCILRIYWYHASNNPITGVKWGPGQASSSGDVNIVSSDGNIDLTLQASPSSVDPTWPGFYALTIYFRPGNGWRVIRFQRP